MISQDTLEEIKRTVRLVDVIGAHVSLTRRGTNFIGLCPFHSEKSPSFNVSESDNFFHCFGCSASGNVISWFMQFEGLSFPDAVQAIGERYGIVIKREGGNVGSAKKSLDTKPIFTLNSLALKYYQNALRSAPAPVQRYCAERGVTEEVAEYFGIGYAPVGWRGLIEFCRSKKIDDSLLLSSGLSRRNSKGDLYDTFRARLLFPVWIDGRRVAGFGGRTIPGLEEGNADSPKYINSPESPTYQKSSILYGLPQALATIRETKEVIIVEGYMDVISLHKVGVTNAVATCGTALTSEHVRRLKSLGNRVLLLFDGDRAGRAAASKCFKTFVNSGLDARVLFLDEKQDPDSIAREHGRDTLQFLASQEVRALLDCWIDHLVGQSGFESLAALGAAARGKISSSVAETLRQVENKVEREELIKNAAFLLKTSREDLAALVDGVELKPDPEIVQPQSFDAETTGTVAIPTIAELNPLERELLYALMAEKNTLPEKILSEPILIEGLHPAVVVFAQNLQEIIHSATLNQSDKKETIKSLLKANGPSWLEHWKKAFRLQSDREVDPIAIFNGCIAAVKRERAKRTLAAVQDQINNCSDEAMRTELIQQKIELLKSGYLGGADS